MSANKGCVVNVPICPKYCFLLNLGLPLLLQYGKYQTFNYFDKINQYLPTLPSSVASSLPAALTDNSHSLLWRGTFGLLLLVAGDMIQRSGKKAMRKVDVTPPHGNVVPNLVLNGAFKH
eukprot:133656_1